MQTPPLTTPGTPFIRSPFVPTPLTPGGAAAGQPQAAPAQFTAGSFSPAPPPTMQFCQPAQGFMPQRSGLMKSLMLWTVLGLGISSIGSIGVMMYTSAQNSRITTQVLQQVQHDQSQSVVTNPFVPAGNPNGQPAPQTWHAPGADVPNASNSASAPTTLQMPSLSADQQSQIDNALRTIQQQQQQAAQFNGQYGVRVPGQ